LSAIYRWLLNKRKRNPKGRSQFDNKEKLSTQNTQDEEKNTTNTICVGHH
jgi:hypothetical protein